MAYLSVHWRTAALRKGGGEHGWNTVPCRAVIDVLVTSAEPSSQPPCHQPGISHTGPQLKKCHWCTLTYIWPNELHYLFTHSSSSLLFERLGGSWISFCTKGFSELLGLALSSQGLPGVTTWWHLERSTAVLWRLQPWLSSHRAGFSTARCVHGARKSKFFMESGPVGSPVSRIRLLLGLSPANWLRLRLAEMSNDVSCFALMPVLNHSCQNPSIQHIFNLFPKCSTCKISSGSTCSEMKIRFF